MTVLLQVIVNAIYMMEFVTDKSYRRQGSDSPAIFFYFAFFFYFRLCFYFDLAYSFDFDFR